MSNCRGGIAAFASSWADSRALHLIAAGLLGLAPPALQAQSAYTETRTSSFSYYGPTDGAKNGQLKGETVEPDAPQMCVTTTYDYSDRGNRKSSSTDNCPQASGRALFTARTSSTTYAAVASQTISVNGANVVVATAEGIFADSTGNALNQVENRTYDPRFGAMLSVTGPNTLTTRWVLDDFGRKVQEVRPDNTSTYNFYCAVGTGMDTSANTAGCPVPGAGEVPADAAMFAHTEPRNAAGQKMGPFVRIYNDRLGREIRSVTESFDGAGQPAGRNGALIATDTVYNAFGAKVLQTQPYFLASGSSTLAGSADMGVSRTDYDVLGRPVAVYVTDPHGSQPTVAFGSYGNRRATLSTLAYAGSVTTAVNDKGQTRIEERNANGELLRVTDATGAQVAYQRDAFSNLVITKDALQNMVTVSYDRRGRKLQMQDADTGTWRYDYDALGQLVWQQSANQLIAGTETTVKYDVLGRMTSRTEPEYVSNWYYDKYADGSPCTKATGKLCESTTSNGLNRRHAYDTLGRPIGSVVSVTNGPRMATALAYESGTGRVTSQTYPTGLQVGYAYTARGYLEKLTLQTSATLSPLPNSQGQTAAGATLAAGTVLWQAQAVNAWGRLEQQQYSSGVVGKATYDPATGRTLDLTAGQGGATTVLDQHYTWDNVGNLVARADANGDGNTGAVTETFDYGDGLNRLTGYQVSAPAIPSLTRTVQLHYNALGMLLYKSDVGNYSYNAQGGAHPHALQSVAGSVNTGYTYDANGNLAGASAGKYRSLSYTSFNLPDSQSGLQGAAQYTWRYDENHARVQEMHVNSAGTRTTWYLHPDNAGGLGFESEISPTGAPSQRHYLSANGRALGVLVSATALPTLAAGQTTPPTASSLAVVKLEYWHKDQLGSIITTTDHTGAVTQRHAYDPMGKRRYTNGNYDDFGNLVVDWSASLNSGTDRGFTGHEHLDDVGLVHMNGRLFDSTLGIFLQADPLNQAPDNLQNYNRYGYCYYNPLTCTDPTGFGFLGDVFGGVTHAWKSVWHSTVGRIVIVAVVSYMTYGAGSDMAVTWLSQTSMAATEGFSAATIEAVALGGGGLTAGFSTAFVMSNGDLKAGLKGGLIGGLTGAAIGGMGLGSNIGISSDASPFSSAADFAKFSGKRLSDYYLHRETDRYFEKQFGISGFRLDMALTAASFAGDAVFGSRYKGIRPGSEPGKEVVFIDGIFSRKGGLGCSDSNCAYNLWSAPAEIVDIVLLTRGMPTASGWNYIVNGAHGLPLVGYSLGAGDVNMLAAWGLGSRSGNLAVSLPVGQVGAPNTNVVLGLWDPVNAGFIGGLTSPGALVEDKTLLDHMGYNYCSLRAAGFAASCP